MNESEGQRQSAAAVFRDRATRLDDKAEALRTIATLIEENRGTLTEREEERLWSLACGIDGRGL